MMKAILKPNTINQIEKGAILFQENDQIEYICLVVKGRVAVYNQGVRITMGSGSFLGVEGLYMGRYLNSYSALDDLAVFAFPVAGIDSIERILTNKDYRGFMVMSLLRYILELNKTRIDLLNCADTLFQFIKSQYLKYTEISRSNGSAIIHLRQAEELTKYESEFNPHDKKLCYMLECAQIPLDIQRSFYSVSSLVSLCHIEEISGVVTQLTIECIEIVDFIIQTFYILYNNSEKNLLKGELDLAITLNRYGKENSEVTNMVDSSVDKINEVEKVIMEKTGSEISIDRSHLEQMYYLLLTGDTSETAKSDVQELQEDRMVEIVNGSLMKILEYSGIDKEKSNHFISDIEAFIKAVDRMSTENDMRLRKHRIAASYYEIYEAVFLNAYGKAELSTPIRLFLDYGFVDERLLSKEQLVSLIKLDTNQNQDKAPCNICTFRDWLTLIYEGKKEPSKNEFDLEYADGLRADKKQGKISEEQEKAYLSDVKVKLAYEIKNMFTYNNKLCNGQITTYVPVLYKEEFFNKVELLLLTKEQIDKAIQKIKQIDFSLFYREIVYSRPEIGITREFIMQEVYPDIILLPVYGTSGSMWQEVSGKRRENPGRFMLPIFLEGNIDDVMLKLLGRYRWEFCRFLQGAAWNNIKYRSMTSEYADYIQFYRKNRDLSEERKEKLKLQIQKGRNNLREIFTIDYEIWIRNESEGALRLNKFVREILATYCPLCKECRNRLQAQPLFEEAMGRYRANTAKKLHELDLRTRLLQKDNIDLPKEINETLVYYKEL